MHTTQSDENGMIGTGINQMTIPFGKYVLDVENKDAVLNRKLSIRDGNKTINGIIEYFQLIDLTLP
jgi:hypothetical protein